MAGGFAAGVPRRGDARRAADLLDRPGRAGRRRATRARCSATCTCCCWVTSACSRCWCTRPCGAPGSAGTWSLRRRPPGLPGGLPVDRGRGRRRHAGGRVLRVARLRPGVRGDPQRARPDRGGLGRAGRDGRRHRRGLPAASSTRAGRRTTLIEAYARAKAEVRDVDDGELRPSSYDPQRLRDSLDTPAPAGHEAVHRARPARAERRGGRADRGGGAGPAPDPRRPVRHDRRAGPPGLRHRPGDQGADAAGAALRRAGAGRGADLERAGQRGDAQGQRRAGLPPRPGLVRIQRRRRRAGAPPGRRRADRTFTKLSIRGWTVDSRAP